MYIDCMRKKVEKATQKSVPIRVRKESRERLHSVKNPGQTLDGIITQLIDLWETQKRHDMDTSKELKQGREKSG